jgi:hypothetical protein
MFVSTGSVTVLDALAPPVPGHVNVAVYWDVAAPVPSAPVEADPVAASLIFGIVNVPSVADSVQVEPNGTPVALQLSKAEPPSATLVRLAVNDVITGGTPGVTGTLSVCTSVLPFAPGQCSVTLKVLVNGPVVTEPPAFVP